MSRHLARGTFVTLMLATIGAPDLSACGDKFLLVGRSLRYKQAFASTHPSSIVAYAASGSPVGELVNQQGFAALLTFAGHNVRVVDSTKALGQALNNSRVDLVLADVQNGPELQRGLAGVRSHPLLVPIVFNASRSASASVEQQYGCVIRIPSRAIDALAAVEEAVKLHTRQTR